MLGVVVNTLHVILAGVWLGGVVFTTTVVSPALKSMGQDEAERSRVRSVIGRQYAKVGTANLVLLSVLATPSTRCWRCFSGSWVLTGPTSEGDW